MGGEAGPPSLSALGCGLSVVPPSARCLHAHRRRAAAVDGLGGHGRLLRVRGPLVTAAQVVSPRGGPGGRGGCAPRAGSGVCVCVCVCVCVMTCPPRANSFPLSSHLALLLPVTPLDGCLCRDVAIGSLFVIIFPFLKGIFIYLRFQLTKVNDSLLCTRHLARKFLSWELALSHRSSVAFLSFKSREALILRVIKDFMRGLHRALQKKAVCPEWLRCSWILALQLQEAGAGVVRGAGAGPHEAPGRVPGQRARRHGRPAARLPPGRALGPGPLHQPGVPVLPQVRRALPAQRRSRRRAGSK